MTASQRPERVDRDALVDAAAKAIHAAAWEFQGNPDQWWEEADELDRTMATEQAIAAVRALIAHARLISPSERAVIYVADLERALGIDAPVPHKVGGGDDQPTPAGHVADQRKPDRGATTAASDSP